MDARERALFDAWRAGDRRAGGRLLAGYEPVIRAAFRGLAADVADDLTQETLVAALEGVGRLAAPERLRGYLCATARRRRARWFSRRRLEPVGDAPAIEVTQPAERAWWVRAGVAALAPSERELMIDHYVRGFTTRELAERHGVPAPTLKSRLRRGRARLRSALGAAA